LLAFRLLAGLHPDPLSLRSTLEAGRSEGLYRDNSERKSVAKLAEATCADCYFRRAGLCALPTEAPCPTFRAYARGSLAATPQPRLVPRPLAQFAAQHAAA
jgi:hypothetical protein